MLDETCLRAVRHAVAPQPSGGRVGRHTAKTSTRLDFACPVLPQSTAAADDPALKRRLIEAIRLFPSRDRITLHRRWLMTAADLTVPESLLDVAVRLAG